MLNKTTKENAKSAAWNRDDLDKRGFPHIHAPVQYFTNPATDVQAALGHDYFVCVRIPTKVEPTSAHDLILGLIKAQNPCSLSAIYDEMMTQYTGEGCENPHNMTHAMETGLNECLAAGEICIVLEGLEHNSNVEFDLV